MTGKEIRQALSEGCPEEELKAFRCPVCGGGVTFHVHSRRKMFFVRCVADSTHMGLHGMNPASPDWWEKYVEHEGWIS